MPEFLPLSDLRDPVGFLKGARVPLHDLAPEHPADEWHYCASYAVRVNLIQHQPGMAGPWLDFFAADEIPPADLALDLSDPDIARWCDRKIAGRVARHPFLWAVLSCREGFWEVIWGSDHEIGRCGMSGLTDLPGCTTENIPTARAALLRALYGRTP